MSLREEQPVKACSPIDFTSFGSEILSREVQLEKISFGIIGILPRITTLLSLEHRSKALCSIVVVLSGIKRCLSAS